MKNKCSLAIAIAGIIAVIIWLSVICPGRGNLSVTFLDVGDGLCSIVRSPSGKVLVMDCGSSSWHDNESVGGKLAAPYLQSMGVDAIDVAVISHPHSDHVSGYASLLEMKSAKIVLGPESRCRSSCYKKLMRVIKQSGAVYKIARAGQSIDMGDGTIVEVLNPPANRAYENLNDTSIALRVIYRHVAVLLAADTQADAECSMVNSGRKLRAQVLQVGHHGSEASTSTEWLEAVNPDIAVVSCSRRSHYGFPSAKVLDRLALSGAKTYVTGMQGAVTITTDGTSIRVNTNKRTR